MNMISSPLEASFLVLFLLTIGTAVACHSLIHLPPVLGMMMGLGYLQFFGYFLRVTLPGSLARKKALAEQKGDKENATIFVYL